MKQCGGLLRPLRELSTRMNIWTLPQMTSHLCVLVLSSVAVSLQLGLEDVFFSPQDQTVREGEGVFFQCVSGESSPPAGITWLKDGAPVTRGRKIQGEYGGGNQKKTTGTLHLFNATLKDAGIYICVTRNAFLNISKRSKPAKLTVQGVLRRLQIVQGPDNLTVAMGTEVSMHCAVRGFPVPMVHWFKDGCLLTNCSASFSLQNNGQLLTFRNVTKEDEGSYHCEATNQRESIRSKSAFLTAAEMDWSFVQQPTNRTVKRGENVTITCRPPYSRPAAEVSWFRDNQLLVPAAHITVLPTGDLSFNSVQESDSGSYFCRASNVHLQRFLTSRRATLSVLAPPSVRLWPQVLTVPVGARVVLECHVSGRPAPSISWVKRGRSKQTGGQIIPGFRNATLYIQSARSYDEGVYACEASNSLGQARNTAMLKVAVSPIIVSSLGHVSYRIGAPAVLPCRAVGILPITYTWTRGRPGSQSPVSPGFVDDNGALHIPSVQYSDAGDFYCTAENRAGRHQRRTVLTVTAEHHAADRDKQAGWVVSASTSYNKGLQMSSMAVQHPETTHQPHSQSQATPCSSSNCGPATNRATTSSALWSAAVAQLTMPPRTPGRLLQQQLLNQPTTNPTQPLITQMQPPMLPPPPRINFQSVDLRTTRPKATSEPTTIPSRMSETVGSGSLGPVLQLTQTERAPHVTLSSLQTQHGVNEELVLEPVSQSSDIRAVSLPVVGHLGFLRLDSYLPTLTTRRATSRSGVSASQTSPNDFQSKPQELVTELPHPQSSTGISQTGLEQPRKRQPPSMSLSQSSKSDLRQPFTQKPNLVDYLTSTQLPPSAPKPQNSQIAPSTQTISTFIQSSTTEDPLLHSQAPPPLTEAFPLQQRNPTTIISPGPTSSSSTMDSEVHVQKGVQLNTTQQGDPVQSAQPSNNTEQTEWLKRNTSQSPMTSNDPRETEQSPSWLPVLEKHDIPIVVGVGVSLAFIFITVTFYSVVQKNEPAPTSRAEPTNMSLTAQRNLGVPVRHAERRAAGRTYENRAFEDDDCVAVIEQSPNTSDTRARPPGPSLVTVQLEPTFEEDQEDAVDNHSVTVETYPEPLVDTKIDSSLDEEKVCSLSQPSIQLQSAEDWTSNRGDNRSPCQDALPPPSSLPSRSPSPSPPSGLREGLRSSLTLQSAETCAAAPIHHSLSVSHGNPPLLLSHHVSLGLTTVAVDVHFYPAATSSTAVATSTHITSVSSSAAPLFSPSSGNNQENDQSAAKGHHS